MKFYLTMYTTHARFNYIKSIILKSDDIAPELGGTSDLRVQIAYYYGGAIKVASPLYLIDSVYILYHKSEWYNKY